MVSASLNLWLSFLAGLYTPIGAVCVLPLYPGFLAYLTTQFPKKLTKEETSKKFILLGIITASGVLTSMFLLGLIFTLFLKSSLTKAIGIISPIAFSILAIVSIFLILNINYSQYLPRIATPFTNNPLKRAFLFGFFFGAIVIPCNPASLVVLFAISTSITSFLLNLLHFLLFGLGMALPLLLFAVISSKKSTAVIGFLTTHHKAINRIAGFIMLAVSLYYLIFVFKIFS